MALMMHEITDALRKHMLNFDFHRLSRDFFLFPAGFSRNASSSPWSEASSDVVSWYGLKDCEVGYTGQHQH